VNKALLCFAILVFTLALIPLVGIVHAPTYTFYARSDTKTVNGILGYYLNDTQTASTKSVEASIAGAVAPYYGVRIWRTESDNSSAELTTDYLSVYRTGNTSGLQNMTWTPTLQPITYGFTALKVNVYIKMGTSGTWTLKATFTTMGLLGTSLEASTWTIRLWTYRSYSTMHNSTTGMVYWGNTPYSTTIESIQVTSPTIWQVTNYGYQSGNLLSAIMTPYTFLLGELAYGLIALIIAVCIYNRTENVAYAIIVFILLNGLFVPLIPSVALQLVYVVIVVGLAALFWKLYTSAQQP